MPSAVIFIHDIAMPGEGAHRLTDNPVLDGTVCNTIKKNRHSDYTGRAQKHVCKKLRYFFFIYIFLFIRCFLVLKHRLIHQNRDGVQTAFILSSQDLNFL